MLFIKGREYTDDQLVNLVVPQINPSTKTISFSDTSLGLFAVDMAEYQRYKQNRLSSAPGLSTLFLYETMKANHDHIPSIEQLDANRDGIVTDDEIENFVCFQSKGLYYFGKQLSLTNVETLTFNHTKISNVHAYFLYHGLINGGNCKIKNLFFSKDTAIDDEAARMLLKIPTLEKLAFHATCRGVSSEMRGEISTTLQSRRESVLKMAI